MMKKLLLAFSLFLTLSITSFARNVMTWVPVYGIGNCKNLINNTTTSGWLKNGLTHIGLQFWVPGDNGEVVILTDYQYTYKASTISQDVKDFVTWGNANDVKIMLCIHNIRQSDFDWAITRTVINNYPNETVTNILSIVNLYGLDGVDIDFEGIGDYSSDKAAFTNFLDTLGTALHAVGKELSVDMFSTPCYNAPNPSWESVMAPHVDFMNIMGYNDTYESNNTLFQYCPQAPSEVNVYAFRYSYIENYLTVKQGLPSSLLNYGLPSWVSDWGGLCAQENILDIVDISSAGGIAIWDMQLNSTIWKDPITWDIISKFKNNKTSNEIRSGSTICGIATSVATKEEPSSPISYDYNQRLIKFSETEGNLYLYSTLGIVIKSWNVKKGDEIILNEQISNGVYILNYRTDIGVFSQRIYYHK